MLSKKIFFSRTTEYILSLNSLFPLSLSSLQEQWSVRSKGLLQDFAYGQLGRVRQARARALSGGGDSEDEEENKDYDMIRGETKSHLTYCCAQFSQICLFSEIAESSRYGATQDGERQPLLPNGGPVLNFTGGLTPPGIRHAHRSAEFTIGERDTSFQRQRRLVK